MLTELNILKFYGILLVVLGHVVFTYSPMSIITPSTPSPILNSVKKVIYAFHMPLFIFASGCIFAWQLEVKKKSMTFVQLFKNKFKRFIDTVLCVWTIDGLPYNGTSRCPRPDTLFN